jgi:hypothetical protein
MQRLNRVAVDTLAVEQGGWLTAGNQKRHSVPVGAAELQ